MLRSLVKESYRVDDSSRRCDNRGLALKIGGGREMGFLVVVLSARDLEEVVWREDPSRSDGDPLL